jgi:hypothetical protein
LRNDACAVGIWWGGEGPPCPPASLLLTQTGVKLNSLKHNFDSFSQQTLVRLENVRGEILDELGKEVRSLSGALELVKKQIAEIGLNQDDLGRRLERQGRQILTQETLGERLSRDAAEAHKGITQLQGSQDSL